MHAGLGLLECFAEDHMKIIRLMTGSIPTSGTLAVPSDGKRKSASLQNPTELGELWHCRNFCATII